MKVNSINSYYNISPIKEQRVDKLSKTENSRQKFVAVNFKGHNNDEVIFYGAEMRPYFSKGGVSTVVNDMRAMPLKSGRGVITDAGKFEFWTQPDRVFVSPFYNGRKIYNEKGLLTGVEYPQIPSDLPDGNPFKPYAGKYFMTNDPAFNEAKTIKDFLVNLKVDEKGNSQIDKSVFIVDDVTGGEKTMEFAGEKTPIKLFRRMKLDGGTLKPTNDFFVGSDIHLSWPAPYGSGGYSSNPNLKTQRFIGDGDAKGSKAFVEFAERICEQASTADKKFDPATIMLNDSQVAYVTNYMAEKAVAGDSFYNDIKATFTTHNTDVAYTGITDTRTMFMNIADKELVNAVDRDPQFIEALKKGEDAVNEYFGRYIPKEIIDAQGQTSSFKQAIYYASKGYVPGVNTVSEGYFDKMISDPDMIISHYNELKSLADKNIFIGITNASQDPVMDITKQNGLPGYFNAKNEVIYTFPAEAENGLAGKTIKRFDVCDASKVNEKSVDATHVREIKRKNKINLFERCSKESLDALERLKNVKGHEKDMAKVVAGLDGKAISTLGYIDKKYVNKLQNGEDVKLIVSWGRVCEQKGLDTVLEAFEKYAEKAPDDSVLILGGPDYNPLEGEGRKISTILDRMLNNPKLKGRFVFMDGFGPAKALVSAGDFAMLPSRFAPCELTDLEAMKLLCMPIVTNCQGLAQKNFDATFANEADKVTGYKTKHGFDMTYEELKNSLPAEEKPKLEAAVTKFRNEIAKEYRKIYRENPTPETIDKMIKESSGLHYRYNYEVLREFKDKLLVNELVDCMKRGLEDDWKKGIQDKMFFNHVAHKTDWDGNAWLSKYNKSAGELYREMFGRNFTKVNSDETLLSMVKKLAEEDGLFERAKTGNSNESTNSRFMQFIKSKKGKWTVGGTAALAVLAAGTAIYKNVSKNKAEAAEEVTEDKELALA
ncbi:MAG: glycogen/starch synthase [bacterium]|nr:glycogen/starch synthase [bacterium]